MAPAFSLTAEGRIPVIVQQRLKVSGDRWAVNGEAIYNIRKGADLYAISTR